MLKKLFGFVVIASIIACQPMLLGGTFGRALQGTPTGTLTGIARDEAGAVVPSAQVTAVNVGTNAALQATTDADGIYTLRTVPVGT